MTEDEKAVLELLAEAWNRFCALPMAHNSDKHEFMHAIHAAQNIVLARAATKEIR